MDLTFDTRPMAATFLLLAVSACGGDVPPDAGDRAPAVQAAEPGEANPLLDPSADVWKETAPDTFRVRFVTTKGPFVMEVYRDWAPIGADRFYNLARTGFYDGAPFFRVIDGFMAQFGLHGDPEVASVWWSQTMPDDSVRQSNVRGSVSYAMRGPYTRTTQVFISYRDNSYLDRMGFAPFGRVLQGMDVVDSLYSGYGESAPQGDGPDVRRIHAEGNAYLRTEFPDMDYVETATLIET